MNGFLPINKQDMLDRGWDYVDFVYITGDSYVDHPSFGASIITRVQKGKRQKCRHNYGGICSTDDRNGHNVECGQASGADS